MARTSKPETWADFWDVTERTIFNWRRAHAEGKMPSFENVDAMLKWQLTARNSPPAFAARCAELRAGVNRTPPIASDAVPDGNPVAEQREQALLDWKAFKERLSTQGPRDHQAQINNLGTFLEFYEAKLEEANQTNDQNSIKFYNALVLDTSNTIRQQKLAADKLGLEEGALFTKEQVEKIIRALAFWSMRGIDADLAELCTKLTGKANVPAVREVLEPALLSARFVRPFARASRIESGIGLDGFVVATMKDAVDDYIENGAKEFEEVAHET